VLPFLFLVILLFSTLSLHPIPHCTSLHQTTQHFPTSNTALSVMSAPDHTTLPHQQHCTLRYVAPLITSHCSFYSLTGT
jgi:hypothetical protein